MKRKTLNRLPQKEDIERAREQLALRHFLRKPKTKKQTLEASAFQKEQLIKRLLITNKNTRYLRIFKCCHCQMWRDSERLRTRTHWDSKVRKVEIFRVCFECQWVLKKMNIELRWVDAK